MATRRDLEGHRPPAALVATASLLCLVALMFAYRAGATANLLGFVTGSVLGVFNLAAFLVVESKRRATHRYSDWKPSAKTIVSVLTLTAWAIGAWNVFFWALEVTRP